MKVLVKITVILAITGGVVFFSMEFFDCMMPHYEKVADRITARTAKKLEKEKHLYLIGTGGGMMYDVRKMSMDFQFYHELDLKESRKLLVDVVEEYLREINNSEKIRPYLHNYPFTVKNIEIGIWIYNPDKTDLPPEKISYISALDGVIDYYGEYSGPPFRKVIHEETYEEALKALQAQ